MKAYARHLISFFRRRQKPVMTFDQGYTAPDDPTDPWRADYSRRHLDPHVAERNGLDGPVFLFPPMPSYPFSDEQERVRKSKSGGALVTDVLTFNRQDPRAVRNRARSKR